MYFIIVELCSQSRGFAAYSVRDGLAQSNVMDIAEDRFGNLWLATNGGLSKFNGVDFATFKKQNGLASNKIFCVTIDGEGNVWVGTDLGISSYDGAEFHNFPLEGLNISQRVTQIASDRYGNIWFSTTTGGVSMMTPDQGISNFRNLDGVPQGKISGFAETSEAIWIATYNEGVFRYQDQQFQKAPLGKDLQQAGLTTIFADQNDRVWLGTSQGLYLWNAEEFEFVHSFHDKSHDFAIYSISEENEGIIWIGTTNGAYRFQQGSCTQVNASDGLTDNIIYKILKDREGTLWFGSFGGGLYKSLGETFTHIGKGHGVAYDYISSISQGEKGDYWFGSYGGGVYHFIPPDGPGAHYTVKDLGHEQGLSNDFVYSAIPDDNGDLWVATAWGLNKYAEGKFTSYYLEHGLPSNKVFSILKCDDGSLFCGTSMGLSYIDREEGVYFKNYLYDGEIPHNRIRTLVEAQDGRILLGTNGGLKVFDGKSIQDYFEIDSLKHWPVSTIFQDNKGGVWCALVDDGILYFDPASGKMMHYTEKQGLSSNIVYSLAMDQLGSLWVGTPHGLDKLSFFKSGEIRKIRNFAANEGFFGIETNTNAIYTEPDGSIWFGTVEGAFKCHPKLDRINILQPITYITGIRLFSQKVDWSELSNNTTQWFNLPENLKLSHTQNHLTFEFFGNSLRNPDRVSYQYTLENFDPNWQPVTKKKEAVYTNLPPEDYVFKVRASNNDGVWNEKAASFGFEITPPYWRTWWFFTLSVLIVGIAGRLYYNFRVQEKLRSLIQVEKIKDQETVKVRRRVAEDFHDQVGNQLASINVLVQLIQAKLSSGNKGVEELLQKLGQFTKTLFTGTRDFIWSIDPQSDDVNEMLIYIKDFGEELFEYSGINFYVDTNHGFDAKMKLPIGWSRHVVFIFKEALTNSLKHANCKNVYLNFNVSDHNFVFELKDDGIGLNGYHENDYLGMGFQNMKERAKTIGGEIVISSGSGIGTKVTLEGKIPQNEG